MYKVLLCWDTDVCVNANKYRVGDKSVLLGVIKAAAAAQAASVQFRRTLPCRFAARGAWRTYVGNRYPVWNSCLCSGKNLHGVSLCAQAKKMNGVTPI